MQLWFVGVDWGSQKHQVCVIDAGGEVVGERAFEHGGLGLTATRRAGPRLHSPPARRAGLAGPVGLRDPEPGGNPQ